jgi:aerobic C4-dicarboxylate transport protein
VVARWEKALDVDRMRTHLDQETDEEADDPETVLVDAEEAQMRPVAINVMPRRTHG